MENILYFLELSIGSIAIGINATTTATTPSNGALCDEKNFLFGRNILLLML